MEEYIADLTRDNEDNDPNEDPWIDHEKEMFSKKRDKNGDGFMDFDEVRGKIGKLFIRKYLVIFFQNFPVIFISIF